MFSKSILLPIVILAISLAFIGCNACSRNQKAKDSTQQKEYSAKPEGSIDASKKIIRGKLDEASALQLLYGNYDAQNKLAQWTPTQAELAKLEVSLGTGQESLQVRTVITATFRQNGVDRYILITAAASPNYECHACAPAIGGATFSKAGDVWRLDTDERFINIMGAFGRAPEGKLAKIGPDKYGVLFRSGYVAQGLMDEGAVLVAELDGSINELADIQETAGSNFGNCEENSGNCWQYDSRIEFVPGSDPNYFDIVVTTNGTRESDDGHIKQFKETRRYIFSGGAYELSQR